MKHALKILYGVIILLSVMILLTVFSFIRRNQPAVYSKSVAASDTEASSDARTGIRSLVGSRDAASSAARIESSENAASEYVTESSESSASAGESQASENASVSNSESGSTSSAASAGAAAGSTASPATESSGSSAAAQNIIPTDQTVVLDTVMGNMQYFNQTDSHWGSYLISGKDLMDTNGCGPTCVSMVIHAFGSGGEQVTPVTMADWAVANNQYVVGAGSQHTIVETALPAYGLKVTSLQNSVSKETIVSELSQKHLLIGLMGPGYFTDEGHYLLMTGIDGAGNICIADPHSSENTSKSFTPDFLISQLRKDAKDGGAPLWSISRQ